MTKKEVYALAQEVGPRHEIDPVFLTALCQMESSCDETEVRLENGFYRRYARPMNFPTSTEVLFSASYGLTQVMGEVLFELGYFDGRMESVAELVDAYVAAPELQLDYACRQLVRIRRHASSLRQILLRYNGGGDPHYPDRVIDCYAKRCREYGAAPLDSPV